MGSNWALSPEHQQNISKALAQRGVTLPCPRCGENAWNVLDVFISNPLAEDVGTVTIGGPVLPTIGVLCARCGFLAEHAVASLGLASLFEQTPANGEAVE